MIFETVFFNIVSNNQFLCTHSSILLLNRIHLMLRHRMNLKIMLNFMLFILFYLWILKSFKLFDFLLKFLFLFLIEKFNIVCLMYCVYEVHYKSLKHNFPTICCNLMLRCFSPYYFCLYVDIFKRLFFIIRHSFLRVTALTIV